MADLIFWALGTAALLLLTAAFFVALQVILTSP
jgi:hypothetical protein